jgi:hypothetical protein
MVPFRCARTRSLSTNPGRPEANGAQRGEENRRHRRAGRRPCRHCGPGRPRRRATAVCAAPAPGALRDPHQPGPQRPGRSRLARARQADAAAVATPARVRLGDLARIWSGRTPRSSRSPAPSGWPPAAPRPSWPRALQSHYARVRATTPASAPLRPRPRHYARVRDEPSALIRESLTIWGDIHPHPGQLLIQLDPLTVPRRPQALAAFCRQLNTAQTATQAPSSSFAPRSNPTPDPA